MKDFSSDIFFIFIVIGYWSGIFGSIISFIYDQPPKEIATEVTTIPVRVFLGGTMGIASVYFIKSGIKLKFLYPAVQITNVPKEQLLSYSSGVAVAVLSGLLAPTLIKGIRENARKKFEGR